MKQRTLGKTGIEVSELGLGGLFISELGGDFEHVTREEPILIPDGERHKQAIQQIWERLERELHG